MPRPLKTSRAIGGSSEHSEPEGARATVALEGDRELLDLEGDLVGELDSESDGMSTVAGLEPAPSRFGDLTFVSCKSFFAFRSLSTAVALATDNFLFRAICADLASATGKIVIVDLSTVGVSWLLGALSLRAVR